MILRLGGYTPAPALLRYALSTHTSPTSAFFFAPGVVVSGTFDNASFGCLGVYWAALMYSTLAFFSDLVTEAVVWGCAKMRIVIERYPCHLLAVARAGLYFSGLLVNNIYVLLWLCCCTCVARPSSGSRVSGGCCCWFVLKNQVIWYASSLSFR